MPFASTTALVVEPDPSDRRRLRRYLTADGYETLGAPDARSGLEIALQRPPEVVVVSVDLLGRETAALARRIRSEPASRQATIIAVARPGELRQVAGVMDAGVDDFMAKPFGRPELRSRIEGVARNRAHGLSAESPDDVVAALARATDANDAATARHSERVGRLAADLAANAGLSPEGLEAVVSGAMLHDVGKIGIPDAILQKPGPLSVEEWAILRRHPAVGEAICRPLGMGHHLGPIIRGHHERWDGRGYPDGLAGEMIPLGARIIAIVDAFDAIFHGRPYRRGRPAEAAIEEIRLGAGAQFDPMLADLFVDSHAEADA